MNNRKGLSLGIDLGTSGVRIAVINQNNEMIHYSSINYPKGLEIIEDWRTCCELLIEAIPNEIRNLICTLAIDGTSGTLMACDLNGEPLGSALPYNKNCSEQQEELSKILKQPFLLSSTNSSLTRSLSLINEHGNNLLLRHQADWLNGYFLGNWTWGEENNNLRFGWDPIKHCWPKNFTYLPWKKALPKIIKSGAILGRINPSIAKKLRLNKNTIIVAGTTDSNSAVLATQANKNEGITILGSTIVIKRFVKTPLIKNGISNHFVDGEWICGGASNTGGIVLRQYFSNNELRELSAQINPEVNSGYMLRPLPCKGERFPIYDPELEPILSPRPISDSLFLHAVFEGLARIEAEGWQRLKSLGIGMPKKIITIGGGSNNPQWRRIRERIIGIPIQSCNKPPAIGVAKIALNGI